MADFCDEAAALEALHLKVSLSNAGAGKGYRLPAGTPGECELCGRESPRLIGGECGACRDIVERRARS
jgi:hypothetical protein